MSKSQSRPSRARWSLPGWLSGAVVNDLLGVLNPLDDPKTNYLREEMLSKYLDPKVVAKDDRARAGVKKWLLAEQKNLATNTRLVHAEACNPDFGWCDWYSFVDAARRKIAKVLGPIPDLLQGGELTNGASTRVHRNFDASLAKLKGECHVSSSALNYFLDYWTEKSVGPAGWTVWDSSTMFTVDKKSDIDRVACKEPEGNMLLQRICGVHIRNRLKRKASIDLQDQSRNRTLARLGSQTGDLATIDLSSASDSITTGLVQILLPAQWWALLDDLRVHSTLVPKKLLGKREREDRVVHLEMFSSMGNGFTFELESLIFWAVVKTIQELTDPSDSSVVSVYGDDIICSSKLVRRVERMFHFIGFTMNPKKTNFGHSNPFRESCGGHYYGGFDVSPFYIRGAIRTVPDLIKLLNQLLEWDGRGWGFFVTPELAHFHRKWARYVPRRLHGAVDTTEVGALVTGDMPRDSLTPINRPQDVSMYEHERLIKSYMDLDRLDGVVSPVEVRKNKKGDIVVSSSAPVKVVGVMPRYHPERGTGRRTSWTPYLAFGQDDVSIQRRTS